VVTTWFCNSFVNNYMANLISDVPKAGTVYFLSKYAKKFGTYIFGTKPAAGDASVASDAVEGAELVTKTA
jgi:hypothetical protein